MANLERPLQDRYRYRITLITLLVSLIVIPLGAYTRLGDAGLGCPDWPGCYGQLVLPDSQPALMQAQQQFPEQLLVPAKAWKEMVHRYFAAALGIGVVTVALWSLWQCRQQKGPGRGRTSSWLVPVLLLAIVGFQVVLGMWTVTMKVLPLVVTAHLMAGMAIAALLCWSLLDLRQPAQWGAYTSITLWVIFGLVLLSIQIFLGAWTSTNYAALACPHFPFCQGRLFPPFDWGNAFHLTRSIGPNYEGGRLGMDARVTIQMMHRYMAFITTAFWLPFSIYLLVRRAGHACRRWGGLILLLLLSQFALGVLNVVKLLPLPVAVGHNLFAALLLLTGVTLLHRSFIRIYE